MSEIYRHHKTDFDVLFNHATIGIIVIPVLLKHIVMNLLSNAIKFSPDGSIIQVKTSVGPSSVSLVLSDQGIGIPKEDQQHLFERFFRAGNVSNIQGTGLGLHIVSKYAELLDGQVTCQSQLGQGTTFTVSILNHHHA